MRTFGAAGQPRRTPAAQEVFRLLVARDAVERILDGGADAAELTVSEHASDPGAAELPVVTGAHGAEPARAALALGRSSAAVPETVIHNALVSIREAATATAENVKAGPVGDRRRHRSLHVRAGSQGQRPRPNRSSPQPRARASKVFFIVEITPSGSVVDVCGEVI